MNEKQSRKKYKQRNRAKLKMGRTLRGNLQQPPVERPNIPTAEMMLNVNTNPRLKAEISTRPHTTTGSETDPTTDTMSKKEQKMHSGQTTKETRRSKGMCKNWRGMSLLSVPS